MILKRWLVLFMISMSVSGCRISDAELAARDEAVLAGLVSYVQTNFHWNRFVKRRITVTLVSSPVKVLDRFTIDLFMKDASPVLTDDQRNACEALLSRNQKGSTQIRSSKEPGCRVVSETEYKRERDLIARGLLGTEGHRYLKSGLPGYAGSTAACQVVIEDGAKSHNTFVFILSRQGSSGWTVTHPPLGQIYN